MEKRNRAQISIEYITTYGWAFIVLFGTLTALIYFGVFDLSPYVNQRCDFFTGLYCDEFLTQTTGATIIIQNGLPIDMQNITIDITECATATGPNSILSGETQTYVANCALIEDEIFDTTIYVNYTNPDNGIVHQKLGRLVDRVST